MNIDSCWNMRAIRSLNLCVCVHAHNKAVVCACASSFRLPLKLCVWVAGFFLGGAFSSWKANNLQNHVQHSANGSRTMSVSTAFSRKMYAIQKLNAAVCNSTAMLCVCAFCSCFSCVCVCVRGSLFVLISADDTVQTNPPFTPLIWSWICLF